MTKVGTYKQEAYEQAVSFRKRGFTYAEIAKICNVSKGTVSNWLRHEIFSQGVAVQNKKLAVQQNKKRLELINKARVAERKHQHAEIVRLAEIEYKNYRTSPQFIAGIMVYMTVGDRHNTRTIRLTTSRPELHRLFITFLLSYLGAEKKAIHCWLLLYPEHDEVRCMKYWCRQTTISPAQFYKNQVIQGRGQKQTLHFGVLNIIIGSTLLKKKLETWVKLLEKDTKAS